jgi:hypothetical protein
MFSVYINEADFSDGNSNSFDGHSFVEEKGKGRRHILPSKFKKIQETLNIPVLFLVSVKSKGNVLEYFQIDIH